MLSYTYEYPRPALTVDVVVFGLDAADLKVLLIERGVEPHAGAWAIPGGFVNIDEDIEDAARRELHEETGLSDVYIEHLGVFGTPGRDTRGRVVSVAYTALVQLSDHTLRAETDARDARWFPVKSPPPLAFDHDEMLAAAHVRLKERVRYHPIGFELLPQKFTLSQLRRLYETVLERSLDKRNFRKKIHSMGLLEELNELEQDVPHRAARLYSFNPERYRALVQDGLEYRI